ncbi:MAG TPA: transposase [Planctomycetaceae bacterium]|nr:transposase [Planctomycetaceae bacterium]
MLEVGEFNTGQSAPGSKASRSDCEPYRDCIVKSLNMGLSAKRIFQDLAVDGFEGSYYSARRFTKQLEARCPVPFRRLETEPASEAQVDFGTGAPVLQDGKRKRTHVLRVVLSYSRKGYAESVFRQTTENFIRCIENAHRQFGGTPKMLIIDNLRAAVKKADWFDPGKSYRLNNRTSAEPDSEDKRQTPSKENA